MTEDARSRTRSASRPAPLSAFLALLALSACHPKPAPVVSASSASSVRISQLRHTIERSLGDPALSKGTWGVVVKSLDHDETLYEQNAQKLLMPASALKIATLAVGADKLGWDYRYQTRVLTVGDVEDGVLKGDLLVVGSGDPTLDDWDGKASALFDEWAGRLKDKGIRRISGRVVGDDDAFNGHVIGGVSTDDGLGVGWAWDDLGYSYATSAGALQFNQNTAQLLITPAAMAGHPPTVEVRPASARLAIDNRAMTQQLDPEFIRARRDLLSVHPVPHSSVLELRGLAPLGSGVVVLNVAMPNPTLYFANALRDGLIRNGVDVQGAAVDRDDDLSFDATNAVPLTECQSAPLNEIARTMMKASQNLFAETLLRTIAQPSWVVGSADGGLEDIVRTLTGWGISGGDMRLVDGSGLSRYNLITPAALIAVLAHVYRDERLRNPFLETLPVAGVDGTLQNRMKETLAEGNARAKTGSFSNARTLAGYVRSADGETLAFAIMANNYGIASQAIDSATDAVVVALAQFTRR